MKVQNEIKSEKMTARKSLHLCTSLHIDGVIEAGTDQMLGKNRKTENLSISRYIYARIGVGGVISLKIATGEQ